MEMIDYNKKNNDKSNLPVDFEITFSAADDHKLYADENNRKLAVLTENGYYEVIDFSSIDDCQLDVQYLKKNINKKSDYAYYCDFYVDITLKNQLYNSDISICLNCKTLRLTTVESANPSVNEQYCYYLAKGRQLIDMLSRGK